MYVLRFLVEKYASIIDINIIFSNRKGNLWSALLAGKNKKLSVLFKILGKRKQN